MDKYKIPFVSIHASVKDATLVTRMLFASASVSIHASVKDATVLDKEAYNKIKVSIHASVKDATGYGVHNPANSGFQSTHL